MSRNIFYTQYTRKKKRKNAKEEDSQKMKLRSGRIKSKPSQNTLEAKTSDIQDKITKNKKNEEIQTISEEPTKNPMTIPNQEQPLPKPITKEKPKKISMTTTLATEQDLIK